MMYIKGNILIEIEDGDIKNGTVIVPEGVTRIGDVAFQGCTGLTAITLPESLTHIGYGAFRGCTGLTAITLPKGLVRIGKMDFSGDKT